MKKQNIKQALKNIFFLHAYAGSSNKNIRFDTGSNRSQREKVSVDLKRKYSSWDFLFVFGILL